MSESIYRKKLIKYAENNEKELQYYKPYFYNDNIYLDIDLTHIYFHAKSKANAIVMFYDYLNINCKKKKSDMYDDNFFKEIIDENECNGEDEEIESIIENVFENDTLWLKHAKLHIIEN